MVTWSFKLTTLPLWQSAANHTHYTVLDSSLGLRLFNDAIPVRDSSENREFAPKLCGPGSSVCLATGYGLDGPGSKLGGGEIFRTCPDRPWGPPSLLYNGYRFFPRGKERPGRDADSSPASSAVVKKE